MTHKSTDDLYKRIGQVEQDTATLSADVKNLTHAIEGLISEVRHIKNNDRTNWGTLAAWASVIVGVMIYHNTLAVQPIKEGIVETKEEILRVRNWKDATEKDIPALHQEVKCLSNMLEAKSADRYPRKEAEKDIATIHHMMKLHHHDDNEDNL